MLLSYLCAVSDEVKKRMVNYIIVLQKPGQKKLQKEEEAYIAVFQLVVVLSMIVKITKLELVFLNFRKKNQQGRHGFVL